MDIPSSFVFVLYSNKNIGNFVKENAPTLFLDELCSKQILSYIIKGILKNDIHRKRVDDISLCVFKK